jgi:hypothetical protein
MRAMRHESPHDVRTAKALRTAALPRRAGPVGHCTAATTTAAGASIVTRGGPRDALPCRGVFICMTLLGFLLNSQAWRRRGRRLAALPAQGALAAARHRPEAPQEARWVAGQRQMLARAGKAARHRVVLACLGAGPCSGRRLTLLCSSAGRSSTRAT